MIISRFRRLKTATVSIINVASKRQMTISSFPGDPRYRKTHFGSGAVRPKPIENPMGIFGVLLALATGLFIGAIISKNIANFLDEYELFLREDDED